MGDPRPLGITPFDPDVLKTGDYAEPKAVPLKTLEESAEMVEATKDWLKAGRPDGGLRTRMLDELADVLQTVTNQCAAFGIPDDELYEALRRCETRNRDRGRITG